VIITSEWKCEKRGDNPSLSIFIPLISRGYSRNTFYWFPSLPLNIEGISHSIPFYSLVIKGIVIQKFPSIPSIFKGDSGNNRISITFRFPEYRGNNSFQSHFHSPVIEGIGISLFLTLPSIPRGDSADTKFKSRKVPLDIIREYPLYPQNV